MLQTREQRRRIFNDGGRRSGGFRINYGTGGIGAEIYANRIGVGPMGDCVDCKFEEFFLSAWSVGDPAMVVDGRPNSISCLRRSPGHLRCAPPQTLQHRSRPPAGLHELRTGRPPATPHRRTRKATELITPTILERLSQLHQRSRQVQDSSRRHGRDARSPPARAPVVAVAQQR